MELYEKSKKPLYELLYKTGMTILQLIQNETYYKKPVFFDKTNFYRYIIEYFNNHTSRFSKLELEMFFSFIFPSNIKYELKITNLNLNEDNNKDNNEDGIRNKVDIEIIE
jgi:hypothetical protein